MNICINFKLFRHQSTLRDMLKSPHATPLLVLLLGRRVAIARSDNCMANAAEVWQLLSIFCMNGLGISSTSVYNFIYCCLFPDAAIDTRKTRWNGQWQTYTGSGKYSIHLFFKQCLSKVL